MTRPSGFTLLEMLVALMLFSLVLALGLSLCLKASALWQRAQQCQNTRARLQMAAMHLLSAQPVTVVGLPALAAPLRSVLSPLQKEFHEQLSQDGQRRLVTASQVLAMPRWVASYPIPAQPRADLWLRVVEHLQQQAKVGNQFCWTVLNGAGEPLSAVNSPTSCATDLTPFAAQAVGQATVLIQWQPRYWFIAHTTRHDRLQQAVDGLFVAERNRFGRLSMNEVVAGVTHLQAQAHANGIQIQLRAGCLQPLYFSQQHTALDKDDNCIQTIAFTL
jgi:prepilin-type N-terminal cleavage/methylation domain-containing protein